MVAVIVSVFIIGYLAVAVEQLIGINKAATALITGVLCWTVYIAYADDPQPVVVSLGEHLGELSGILFFLLGAMTIVELVDANHGFDIITRNITTTNKRKLLWIISLLAFFLGAVLDNLATTIVMVTLVRKLIGDRQEKLLFAGMIVIASNAGGAWSPIGDVTTTMLWIGGQITATNIVLMVFFPSLVCLLLPMIILFFRLKGELARPDSGTAIKEQVSGIHQYIILISGIVILLMIPVFRTLTGLPPYMGMLLGLGILWIITEMIHGKKDDADRNLLSVAHALRKIDSPSILFFLGILLAVAALQATGVLESVAGWMNAQLGSVNAIVMALGLLSSVVDNVPLVAAAQGMYSLQDFPTDHFFWEFLAYATGTGGSALIIGSAAGVAAMGMEQISFGWYLRNISLPALVGFFAGAGVYILQHALFSS